VDASFWELLVVKINIFLYQALESAGLAVVTVTLFFIMTSKQLIKNLLLSSRIFWFLASID